MPQATICRQLKDLKELLRCPARRPWVCVACRRVMYSWVIATPSLLPSRNRQRASFNCHFMNPVATSDHRYSRLIGGEPAALSERRRSAVDDSTAAVSVRVLPAGRSQLKMTGSYDGKAYCRPRSTAGGRRLLGLSIIRTD